MSVLRAGKYHLCWALVFSSYAIAAVALGLATGWWLFQGDELVADLPVMRQWWLPVAAIASGVYAGKEARESWTRWWSIQRQERWGETEELPAVLIRVFVLPERDDYEHIGDVYMYGPELLWVRYPDERGLERVSTADDAIERLLDGNVAIEEAVDAGDSTEASEGPLR